MLREGGSWEEENGGLCQWVIPVAPVGPLSDLLGDHASLHVPRMHLLHQLIPQLCDLLTDFKVFNLALLEETLYPALDLGM